MKYVAIGAEEGGSGGGASSTSGNGTAVSSIIGVYDKPIVMHGHLHPGRLLPDSGAKFETRDFTVETYYTWHCTRCGLPTHTTSYDEYNQHKQRHGEATEGGGVGVVLERVTSESMEQFARTICGPDGRTGDIVTMTNNVVVGRINFITGEYTIDLAKVQAAGYKLEGKFFRATWDYRIGREWPQSFCLSVPSEGRLKEGLNTFEVFIDKDGNGEYDAGEPYGFVRDVNVGWDSVPEIVVELRDESPVGERFNIGAQGDISTRVRVVRTAINGQTLKRRRTVYAKTLDLRAGKLFTEADLIGDEEFDFDWSRLTDDAAKFLGIMTNDIRTVDYTVYAGTNIVTTFTRLFDVTNSAPTASGASATHTHTVATAQPTLWWQASAGYPAFALQIAKDEAFSEIVYATTNLMPGATSEGCLFKPEIYVGDGLEDATTYYWRVQQLNAKFTTNKWSKVANFRTAVNSTNADTGYGRVGVDVRYYGPAEAALSDVVVGVYESADFASMPVARKRLSGDGNVSTLVNDANKPFSVVSTNIVLDGIAPGNYYVMAFIDKNGNGRRDYWESWGYVNKITTDDADIYTPATFTVSSAKVDVPTGILVIEDTDVNQNWTPDCLEDDDLQGWKLPSEIEPVEPSADDIDTDGDGLSDSEEDDYGTDPRNPDTDGDGLPDNWEVKNGGDPLFDDVDFWNWAPDDDYMAYVQTNVLVTTVTNADGVASIYAIDPGTNTLYETFYVGGELFVGAVCTNEYAYDAMENGDFMTMVTNATVIHSAVYDWYGFDPTTAKPSYWWPESIAYLAESNSNYTVGANSAPFTRRMKLITQMMYLPMVGAEDDYNLTTWWTDTNGNDMPDGWELYVKYSASSDPGKSDDDYKDDFTGGSDPNSDDTDGDGIPDDVEQFFGVTDPTVPDGNLAIENDVMAFATVNATVVTVQNTAEGSLPMKYLLAEEMAGNTVTEPKVGDYADSLALRATYDYLVPSDANDGSVTNRCGVGTNVTLTAAAGTANRIVAVAKEPVVLVHAQVYDYFGFNKDTANPTAVTKEGSNYVYGANTKAFTALDKYLVVRYFEAYGLADAKTDWKALALAPSSSDNDIDGVPDGWELYTMFGTEGLTATIAAAKISPYNYDDARALAPAGDITLLEKWNGGAPAYDPWSKDSNGNGVDDVDEIKYVLDEPYSDADNDQLPNFTEFLIGSGFSQYSEFAGVSDISATNTYSLTNLIPDYFRRINNKLYLGEMFTDHDFMEDLWEDLFDVTKITRGLYDPWRDSDSDGWSNYAECRAGTNPEIEANTYGMKGMVVKNYPVPTIHAKVVMGPGEGELNGTIVVQAFSDTSKLTGLPDAIWTIPVGASPEESTSGTSSSGSSSSDSSNNSAKTKYLGANPNGEVSFTLSPGFVKPGSVSMSFLDPDFESINSNGVVTALGDINTAEWQPLVNDRPVPRMNTGKILVSTSTNSLEIGTVDYHTGLMTVDYTKLPAAWPVIGEGNDATNSVLLHLANSHVKVSWEAEVAGGNPWMALHLTDSDDTTTEQATLGHVREGKNTFVVFVAGEDGKWAPGNAYGVVQDVDVGWSEAEFTIELTKTTPIMARFDLQKAITAGSFDTANQATDRGNVNALTGYERNKESQYPGTNMPTSASLTRVRVVRNWINTTNRVNDVLFDRRFDLSVHPTLTEYDLLADGKLDLDWGTLNRAFNGSATASASLESATYRVVIGEDDDGGYTDVGEYENYGNNLPTLFSNRYEARTSQTPTVPDQKLAQIVYPSRPTFRWSHTNSIDKAYPAFRLRIYADKDKNTTVYDSGPQRAPARDSNGMYEWTAPVYAGMVTPAGRVLTTTNNYYWAVSMLDAKFTGFSNDEKTTPFRLGMSGNLLDGNEYGSIAVRVKYFGPLVGSLSVVPTTRKNLVRVQAFTSPDFSGLPVAETYVTDVSTIANASVIATNAIIRGVAVNGTYYVRAYIDTDADGVKSDWESWGYNCFVLDPTVASVWRPKPVTVSYQDMMPDATVFIEDADTENDGFPDAWEWNENGNLSSQGPISGNTFFATVNPYLNSTLNAYTKIAGGLEGATGATGNMRSNRLQASISASAQMLADAAETTAVQIKAFSLETGLELEVVNTTSGGDSSSMITFNNEATVQLSLMCATTPDFADAVEVPIKSITIYANKTTDGDGVAVTAEELANARAKAPEARFFKAIIKK